MTIKLSADVVVAGSVEGVQLYVVPVASLDELERPADHEGLVEVAPSAGVVGSSVAGLTALEESIANLNELAKRRSAVTDRTVIQDVLAFLRIHLKIQL